MAIWLARHGQTEMNAAGRYQGRIDSPLTALGVTQADAMARLLAAHVEPSRTTILSSPLDRALATARAIGSALGLPVVTDARLIEVGMGAWEGLTAGEIDAGWPGMRGGSVRNGWFFDAPGGERYDAIAARLGSLLSEAAVGAGQDRILVCHAVAGRVLRGLWAGLPPERAFRLEIPQDAVFRLHGDGRIDRIAAAEIA